MPAWAIISRMIVITYCTQCNWLLRAGWMAQELLSTFAGDLAMVALPRPPAEFSGSSSTAKRSGNASVTAVFPT